MLKYSVNNQGRNEGLILQQIILFRMMSIKVDFWLPLSLRDGEFEISMLSIMKISEEI